MRYNGGKQSVGKRWAEIIGPCNVYWEPFCGMLGVGRHIQASKRIFSDSDPAVISVLKALQQGWQPPDALTQDDYYKIKTTGDLNDPLYGFTAFGCSFAGKRWGGYARSGSRDYVKNAKNSCLQLAALIKPHDEFICKPYTDIPCNPRTTIYCDPPYENTTKVGLSHFDTVAFLQWASEIKAKQVYVSEYREIPGFTLVDVKSLKDGLRAKAGHDTTEALWVRNYAPDLDDFHNYQKYTEILVGMGCEGLASLIPAADPTPSR